MVERTSEFEEEYDDPIRDPKALTEDTLNEPIRLLGPREAVLLGAQTTVAEAVNVMNERKIGSVLVVDGGRLVGIFTDRDVVRRVLPRELPLSQIRISECMTPTPDVLTSDDPIAFALNRMAAGGYRHVPLVDAEGHPVGVVSVRHVVRFIVDHFSKHVLNLPPTPAPPSSQYPPHGAG